MLGLLHRVSTQSLVDLPAGGAQATLFCDFRARLLHRAWVARLADDSVWLLRDDAPGDTLAAHIDRHVFREDVKIENLGDRLAVVGVLGAVPVGGVLDSAPTVGLAPGRVIEREGVPSSVGIAPGVTLELVPASASGAASASPPTPAANAHTWELARIAAGRPRHGHEIAEAFHPFEVGLWEDVHLSKGCYTGQEVLQRLVTYDSVRRRLARVSGPGEPPATPMPACIGKERVGTVTSAARDGAGWTGLAVLAKAALEPGARVGVEDGAELLAIIEFPEGRPRGLPQTSSQRT